MRLQSRFIRHFTCNLTSLAPESRQGYRDSVWYDGDSVWYDGDSVWYDGDSVWYDGDSVWYDDYSEE